MAGRVIDRLLATHPDDAHLVIARAFVDAAGGRKEPARTRLYAARERGAAPFWDAALALLGD
jgi:hypothetical protein